MWRAYGQQLQAEAGSATHYWLGQWVHELAWHMLDQVVIVLNSGSSVNDYARGFQILVSNNGTDWTLKSPLTVGVGSSPLIDLSLASPVSAQNVRIVQTGTSSYGWSIADLNLYV